MKFRKVGAKDATKEWVKSSVDSGCIVATVKKPADVATATTNSTSTPKQNHTINNNNQTAADAREDDVISNKMDVETQRDMTSTVIPDTPIMKKVEYTNADQQAPPKKVIDHFYKIAMTIPTTQSSADSEKTGEADPSDQRALADAGLLSLDEVLLPAIAHQENQFLKQMQRKVQRDAPDQTHIVLAGRAAVQNCLNAAALAVRKSRAERRVLDQQREEAWAQQRQAQREQRRKELVEEMERLDNEAIHAQENQRLKDKRQQKKEFPPNQELWREIAYLMTESGNLEKESRMWQEAESMFEAAEKDMEARELAYEQEKNHATQVDDAVMDGNDENMTPNEVNMQPFDQSMQDIMKSSQQIQAALKMVTDTMTNAGKLRKNLVRKYRQDHQFEGYRGVNDPKGLIRILSQDTEA